MNTLMHHILALQRVEQLEDAANVLAACACAVAGADGASVFLTDYTGEQLHLTGSPLSAAHLEMRNNSTNRGGSGHLGNAVNLDDSSRLSNLETPCDSAFACSSGGGEGQRGVAGALAIPIGNFDDPLCYAMQSAKPVYFNPAMSGGALSLQSLAIIFSGAGITAAAAYPLLAPCQKSIGALLIALTAQRAGNAQAAGTHKNGRGKIGGLREQEEAMVLLCHYGAAVLEYFISRKRSSHTIRGLQDDLHHIESRRKKVTEATASIIGTSSSAASLRERIVKVAASDAPVFISGETGTGKSLAAKAIHEASNRKAYPFLEINCAAIPQNLLESELFGYAKGAFSGADADKQGLFRSAEGGTVFLDEIAEMPLLLQAKLLHVLQNGKIRPVGSNKDFTVSVKIVSATNKELSQAMSDGGFRPDLYHRLAVLSIHLLPLRERTDDILPIAEFFFTKICEKYGEKALVMSGQSKSLLKKYSYPGNIRELWSIIERSVLLGKRNCGELILDFAGPREQQDTIPHLSTALGAFEEQFVHAALARCNGNITHCAELLGVHQKTLLRKLRKFEGTTGIVTV